MGAERCKKPEIINILLKAGADVHARDRYKQTPLHLAASYTHSSDIIMLLLKAGADAKARARFWRTPFSSAKINKHIKDTEAYWALHDARF